MGDVCGVHDSAEHTPCFTGDGTRTKMSAMDEAAELLAALKLLEAALATLPPIEARDPLSDAMACDVGRMYMERDRLRRDFRAAVVRCVRPA
jgi:hypothetical protein